MPDRCVSTGNSQYVVVYIILEIIATNLSMSKICSGVAVRPEKKLTKPLLAGRDSGSKAFVCISCNIATILSSLSLISDVLLKTSKSILNLYSGEGISEDVDFCDYLYDNA